MSPNDDQNADEIFTFPLEPDDDETILSFDTLRAAFANLNTQDADSTAGFVRLHDESVDESGDAPENQPAVAERDLDENGEPYESIAASDEERCELSPRTIFEAMLFVGNRENKPLVPERAAELMRNVAPEELVEIVQDLNTEYARVAAPYHIIREGDGYHMVLRPEFEPVRARFYNKTRETKLSQTAIDVLAIVAYRQPITADAVQKIHKSPSRSILQQLVRYGLIDTQKILNQKKTVTLYRTTDRFLQLFQLESLDDLPTAEEIDFR
ncbi:MAG: SMC-Scp complex subunit ScpB [Planctomycetaceae bacterium]|nr:SMC-Scp complex subunit ScpB [Planctomycetaceae bacterium]